MIKQNHAAALILCGFFVTATPSFAQVAEPIASRSGAASIDEDIALLRSDLRSNRKQVVAANMKLTDIEAEKFWPIYERYVNELVTVNNAKYAISKDYLQNTNRTEEQADGLCKRWVDVDAQVVQLRLKYIPIFRKSLSAKGTAMFFQIDRRVQRMIDPQLATAISRRPP